MISSRLAVAIAVVALTALPSLGCQTMTWMFDDWTVEDLGAAYHENTQKMIANPAVVNAESRPSEPMDGVSAEHTVETYRARQAQPTKTPAPSIINIGTGAVR